MENLPDNPADGFEDLRMENEVKKMKLMLEHGASFDEFPGTQKLDPALENAFLSQIEEFENKYHNAEVILLYDFIGRPEYSLSEAIPDAHIGEELERITTILDEHQIGLDTLCKVSERELYRFITEELFQHEMENIRIHGMMHCFIYEDFHPNHEYDIRRHCNDGIRDFLNKKSEFYTTYFTKEAENDPWFNHFRDSFQSFSIKHFDILELTFDAENAKVSFCIDFKGRIAGSSEKQRFAGNGTIELLYRYDFWCIQKIQFPDPLPAK